MTSTEIEIVPSGLTVNQEIAARALASGFTQRQAAELARVDQRTIRRWNNQDEFQRFVAWHRANNTIILAQQLDEMQPMAAATLRELMQPGQPPMVRLRASQAVIDNSAKLREEIELRRRLVSLDRALEGADLAEIEL
jgi:hypothetical protein